MEWITIDDGVITGHFCGDKAPDGAIVVENFCGMVGAPVSHHDGDWRLKSTARLVREGLVPVPEGFRLEGGELVELTQTERIQAGLDPVPQGYKLDGGGLVEMSQVERIQAGIERLPDGMKIVDGELVPKTDRERVADGSFEVPAGWRLEGENLVPKSDEEQLEDGAITREEYNSRRRSALTAQLEEIDRKTTRPLRSVLAGTATDDDRARLEELEAQAQEVREKLAAL